MEYLKSFAITLTSMCVFIVAVEMILPENKIKSHQKFVLSLIILSVMLTPIVKLLGGNTNDIARKIENAIDNELTVSLQESFYEKESSTSFVVERLEDECKNLLEKEFTEYKFKVKMDAKMNLDTFNTDFNSVKVSVSKRDKSKIDKVEKVQIGDVIKEIESELSKKIKSFMGKTLEIDEKIISVLEG
ncbi:stage III sporulation protein AF [uncultured Clostridium sp.]|uniref:stage III sporulation protein AF n=1 Tax=uncultured Clostridium sp. TaxID=59620 RepID=UPI00262E8E54|nr:stage III sporulation protein AF [uncultured Clostridium sp.]